MITAATKRLIERVVNVFETGTPDGKYDLLVVYPDGKNGSRQITYGRSQTTEQGNLSKLLMLYIQKGGMFADKFAQYMDRVGRVPLVDNATFKGLLKT
ncbi:MAG: peptidoglycan-binding protein, partial [Bacteroidota bacterium]